MSHVHIYAPPSIERAVRWFDCPDCKRRSPLAILFYEWHGPSSTCMRCGRQFSEDGWMPLDFKRGAREDSKRQMRSAWKRARPHSVMERVRGVVE